MQHRPLLVSSLLQHAEGVFPHATLVGRGSRDDLHRYGWNAAGERARAVARAAKTWGIQRGDRVATLAGNTHRHFELYYAIPGMGAVLHPVNPRLHDDDLVYTLNQAGDRLLFVNPEFLPVVERLRPRLETVEAVGVLARPDDTVLEGGTTGRFGYEAWIAPYLDPTTRAGDASSGFHWPELDEETPAAICYTSGTTGRPKGVVYSHRTTVLHAMGISLPTGLGVTEDDVVLPVVPMYHVLAWGVPFSAALCGYDLVLPGTELDGASLSELMRATGTTCVLGVPTVHLRLLDHWNATGRGVPTLRTALSGGAAPSRSMIQALEAWGVELVHSWGMTETSPVGTMSRLGARERQATEERRQDRLLRQGRPLFGVELRVVDEGGAELPRDGERAGELQVRGLWTISAYLEEEPGSAVDREGWLATGDIAVIHPDGSMRITDRAKDLIKSGGEWISSLALEDAARDHPGIARAAAIAVPHREWGERPLLLVVAEGDGTLSVEEVRSFLEERVAGFWVPERILFLKELPLGGTGKVDKDALRAQYGERTGR